MDLRTRNTHEVMYLAGRKYKYLNAIPVDVNIGTQLPTRLPKIFLCFCNVLMGRLFLVAVCLCRSFFLLAREAAFIPCLDFNLVKEKKF